MKIEIREALNGAIVKMTYLDENDNESSDESVYVFDDIVPGQLAQMLNEIADHFQCHSRYNKYEVVARVEHGDKYECNESDCGVCHELHKL